MKPRIKRYNGTWHCEQKGMRGAGTGAGFDEAFINWEWKVRVFELMLSPFGASFAGMLRFPESRHFRPLDEAWRAMQ